MTSVVKDDTAYLESLLAKLTLEEKVALVQGKDFWSTVPLPSIGLRSMVLSDGPAGVRGPVWDERFPSLSMPSGTAMAASWDVALARRFGEASASEGRRKGVDVVLGPTVNLHRSPLGGRHFECLSEDPWLSAELGVAYVQGLQDNGVAACPKHYIANDSETDRYTVDVRMDEKTLRELYLIPFERSVGVAGAWTMMSSYNSVDGVTLSENELLETPLNSEWGFDGVVISDWTAVRSMASATAAQDLAMPGPAPAWAGFADAVRSGEVPEAALDRKVLRMLRLAARVGALEGATVAPPPVLDGPAFAYEAAVEGMVLVSNAAELPWDPAALRSIAVIGHNASQARFQGGGSATVLPERVVSPLDGVRAAFGDAAVEYAIGTVVQEGIADFPLEAMTNPDTGEPGVVATFRDAAGTVLQSDDRRSTALVWFDGDAPLDTAETLELRTTLTLPDGTHHLGFGAHLRAVFEVDGEVLIDVRPGTSDQQLGASFSFPPTATVPVASDGTPLALRVVFDLHSGKTPLANALGLTVGSAPDPEAAEDERIAEAVAAARAADVAVVVVGTNSKVESEGRDRGDLRLPGRQDDLVAAVAAANPRTVVVVNSGAPVLMPWRDDVKAVLLGWFGGQEIGRAVGDILAGRVEPGGRLPTCWPAEFEDLPVVDVTPRDGRLVYSEGIHIGYRAWLRAGREPAFPFGHGLGYTTWSFEGCEVVAAEPGEGVTAEVGVVRVTVRNTGRRRGKQVVQVYAERPDSSIDRPVRWLVGFAVVRADAGETATVDVSLPLRQFTHWGDDGWAVEPGGFGLRIGSSVVDLPLAAAITPN